MGETHFLEVTLNGFLLIYNFLEVHLQALPFLVKSGSRDGSLHSLLPFSSPKENMLIV